MCMCCKNIKNYYSAWCRVKIVVDTHIISLMIVGVAVLPTEIEWIFYPADISQRECTL